MVAERESHWEEAINAYSAALKASPGDQFALLRRAISYLMARKPKLGLIDCETLLGLSPQNPIAIFSLQAQLYEMSAEIDLNRAELDRAFAILDKLASLIPDTPQAKAALQQTREGAERIRAALDGYEKDKAKSAKTKG